MCDCLRKARRNLRKWLDQAIHPISLRLKNKELQIKLDEKRRQVYFHRLKFLVVFLWAFVFVMLLTKVNQLDKEGFYTSMEFASGPLLATLIFILCKFKIRFIHYFSPAFMLMVILKMYFMFKFSLEQSYGFDIIDIK